MASLTEVANDLMPTAMKLARVQEKFARFYLPAPGRFVPEGEIARRQLELCDAVSPEASRSLAKPLSSRTGRGTLAATSST